MERERDDLDEDGGGLDLRAVIGGLRRRKWLIIGTVFVGVAASVLLASLLTPRYTATSSVMIERHEMPVLSDRPTPAGTQQSDELFVENQMRVLEARTNLIQVIERLGIQHDPEFTPKPGVVSRTLAALWPGETGFAGSSGGSGSDADPAAGSDAGEPVPAAAGTGLSEEAFQNFRKRLSIVRGGQSGAVTVSFTSSDPDKAARIANAVVTSYVESQKVEKIETLHRTSEWLAAEVERLRVQVTEAERSIEEYKVANNLRANTDATFDTQQFLAMKTELSTAHADRIAKEARLRHVYELRARGDGYKPLSEVTSSPIIANLLQRDDELARQAAQLETSYGDRHPQVIRARSERASLLRNMEREVRNVIRNLEGEVEVARAREKALEDTLKAAETESSQAGQASVRLREMERDAASKRSVYDDTLVRLTRIQEQASLFEPDARVISAAAVPEAPSFPKLGMLAGVGFAGSLLLGTGLAALREYWDRGLRTSRQVEKALGVSSLGLVPRIDGIRRRQAPYQYLLERPSSIYAEAVRSLFMRLHLSQYDTPPQVVVVTSTVPGEGKTTLALSLAASVARAGMRTVVVDLDLRQPSVARQLGHPVQAGVLEVLAGVLALDDVILQDPHEPNLHIIPVKGRSGSPTDLLASPSMRSMLADLRCRYDYVILDTPPALAFTDANIVALLADAVLFVVQWEKTAEDLAVSGIETLVKSRAPVIGAAVTQVDLRRHAKYGYGDAGQVYGKYQKYFAN